MQLQITSGYLLFDELDKHGHSSIGYQDVQNIQSVGENLIKQSEL